jgi:hypothetical protein
LSRSGSLPLTLLLHAGLVSAEQPFTAQELERRPQVADCRIFEFTCATCGHITDSDQWDEQNRLISDVEACEKQRADQSVINKTTSTK